MKTTPFALFLALHAGILASCSTSLAVREVEPKDKDAAIDGVPFRMAAPHRIHLYEWNESKASFELLSTHSIDFADTDKLFTVDFSADTLADPTFALTIGPDGTIQKLQLDSQLRADEALGGAVAAADSVKAALLEAEAREKALLAEAKAAEKARIDDATAQENARLSAYQAFLAAETAVAQYNELLNKPDATQADKLGKLNEVYSLQAKANTLYRLAGMTPPYDLDLPGS